ncbi:IFT22 [Branchiostoma lanceolatum]|uniref:IFT22 protein n=1 Tax=Branchiostoma lanceolatum TaxID=7740 RepID=A0A8J9WDJ9_BRALA|nr:IFT22 [Branchiostoma lanceolatum]
MASRRQRRKERIKAKLSDMSEPANRSPNGDEPKPVGTRSGRRSVLGHVKMSGQRSNIPEMFKVKVLVLGPCESGKTVLSNFLADATEMSGDYMPTQGIRFEQCWPAIQLETNGVLLVFNPDQPNHDKELETWYSHFVSQQGLKDSQCLAFAHHKPSTSDKARGHLSSLLSKVTVVHSNIDEDGDSVRQEFSNFLTNILSTMSDNRDKEELSIIS